MRILHNNITELHGHEDGSVPATFQIIYVVRVVFFEQPYRFSN